MPLIGSVLQISDLHFDDKLTQEGRRHWRRCFGVKSHSFTKLDALSGKLAELEGYGVTPDVILATGDISTDGSNEALRVAERFISSGEIIEGNDPFPVTLGLGAGANRRIVLPGNHDRYDGKSPYQDPSMEFEGVFSERTEYPYAIGFRSGTDEDSATLIFFVLDSSAVSSDALLASKAPWRRIARGKIDSDACEGLVTMADEIKRTESVPSISGGTLSVNYENSIRIVALHHHPVDDIRRSSSTNFWTLLENSSEFLRACFRAGVDVVLFGHDHEAAHALKSAQSLTIDDVEGHPIWFFCCASTSEYSSDNGFYLIDFYNDSFIVTPYQWDGAHFFFEDATSYPYQRTIGGEAVSKSAGIP
jgi:hypothetical protein